MKFFFTATPFTLTPLRFNQFQNTQPWVSLNTTGGTSVVSSAFGVPEPEAYAAAAAVGLAGFALWRRRQAR